jgi:hypothetical protein
MGNFPYLPDLLNLPSTEALVIPVTEFFEKVLGPWVASEGGVAVGQITGEHRSYGVQHSIEIAPDGSGRPKFFLCWAGAIPTLRYTPLTLLQQLHEAARVAAGWAEWLYFISCPLLKQRAGAWRQWWNGLTRQEQLDHCHSMACGRVAKVLGWDKGRVEDAARDMDHPYALLSEENLAAMMVRPRAATCADCGFCCVP